MKTFKLVLPLALVAGIVFAAAFTQVVGSAQWFQNGGWFKSKANAAQVTATQKITNSSGCDVDHDFAVLGPYGVQGASQTSFNKTCLGTVIGDTCEVSTKAYVDGGVPLDVELRAFVLSAGTVAIHAHAQVFDAGALDPVDAGYHVRCWSNQ